MTPTPRQLAATALKRLGLYDQVAARLRLWRYRRYLRWVRHEESLASPAATGTTRFSLVVPTHKYTARYLEPLIDSVIAQAYPHWELVIVNACSAPADAEAVTRAARRDDRIREVRLPHNLHIAGNTNAGIQAATGDFISFLDHDDTLAPFALAEMAAALTTDAGIEVFYSDEDKLTDDGSRRFYAFFKPEFDTELILTSNYVCHFLTVKAGLLKRLGGLRSEVDGAQDYDLVLRLLEEHPKVKRIPRISYHWRLAESSTAVVIGEKSYASTAGAKALADHLQRQHITATVEGVEGQATAYRIKYPVPSGTRVAVVTETGAALPGQPAEVTALTAAQLRQTYTRYDVAIFVQAGVEPIGGGWITELTGKALQPGIGVVSGAVLDEYGVAPLGYVRSGGVLVLLEGAIVHPEFTYIGLSSWPRRLTALASGTFAVRTRLLAELTFTIELDSAAALSLALADQGLANVFWPYARLRRGSAPKPPAEQSLPPASRLPSLDPWFHPELVVHNGRADLKIK